jgi:hypothetical protein
MPTFKGKDYSYDKKGYAAYEKAVKEVTGNPTGQGFGAARKGPAVQGPEQDVVVDYSPGKEITYKE